MLYDNSELQTQFLATINTPNLWLDKPINGLNAFTFPIENKIFTGEMPKNIRLGKRVEQFLFNALEQSENFKLLASNYQVQQAKQTIGEIDALLELNSNTIHLEIVYKFYVYDASAGHSEIAHLIGPNRKDRFIKKLDKLKNKQLPLLYHSATKPLLNSLNLTANAIQQQACFKAQIFMPYKKPVALKTVNPNCVVGYYLTMSEFTEFTDCLFYLPTKPNWLLTPYKITANWIAYKTALKTIEDSLKMQQSVCCWIQRTNGKLEKCFVVWW